MYNTIRTFPQQFLKGFDIASKIEISLKSKNIYLTGMGGSTLPGRVIRS